MARGTALSTLREMLKAEIGNALTPGAGAAQDDALDVILANNQEWLWAQWDWPFKEGIATVALTPGTRYYALPGLTLEHPLKVQSYYEERWLPVDYGIEPRHYNTTNSDLGDQEDPVQRWQLIEIDGAPQLEVWPVPATAHSLWCRGIKALGQLSDDEDTAQIDGLLIVLFSAAEILARRKQGDAQAKLAKAQAHLARLKASYPSRNSMFILGGGPTQTTEEPRPTIAITRSS